MKEIKVRRFDYINEPQKLLTPYTVKLIAQIHEYKGKQDLFIHSKKDELASLINVAKIQSTGSSNRIEGIYTTENRLKKLVNEETIPQNRSEKEIVGYRDVLTTIHDNYDNIPVSTNVILQLHRDLYSYESSNTAGRFKNVDNVIAEIDSSGNQKVRFQPMPAYLTNSAMNSLCDSFNAEVSRNLYDELLIILMFIVDFLCIHPFNDGNGRMSRLLTLLLMYKAGYIVGKYISLEMLIENTKEAYYETLRQSSINWMDGTNDYAPFINYYLGILIKAYKEFESRVEYLNEKGTSKSDRVKKTIDKSIGRISKKEIMNVNPDISKVTVERALTDLVKSGYIEKVGAGPSTAYVKVNGG